MKKKDLRNKLGTVSAGIWIVAGLCVVGVGGWAYAGGFSEAVTNFTATVATASTTDDASSGVSADWISAPIFTQGGKVQCQNVTGNLRLCFVVAQDLGAAPLKGMHACEWLLIQDPNTDNRISSMQPFTRNKKEVCPTTDDKLVIPQFVALGPTGTSKPAAGTVLRYQIVVDKNDPAGCEMLAIWGSSGKQASSLIPYTRNGEQQCPGGCNVEGHACTN
jgi:hypothetical protein